MGMWHRLLAWPGQELDQNQDWNWDSCPVSTPVLQALSLLQLLHAGSCPLSAFLRYGSEILRVSLEVILGLLGHLEDLSHLSTCACGQPALLPELYPRNGCELPQLGGGYSMQMMHPGADQPGNGCK